MTLNEFQSRPIAEVIGDMDLVKTQIHSDDDGNVCAVELKYAPKDRNQTNQKDTRLPYHRN